MGGEILNQRVDAAVNEGNRSMDILGGEFCDLVELTCISKNASRGFVIEHLKCLRPDDLKPMDKSFDAGVGVEMSVRNDFLLERYVLCGPAE